MRIRLLFAFTLWLAASPASAAVIARVVAPASVPLGGFFDVELRADLGLPTLGWGLDLGYDPAILQISGAPSLGSDWDAFTAPDGDGLAGVYFPPSGAGLTGDDVLLAVVPFQALALGMVQLSLSATLVDLSEGFALDPEGFDLDVVFQSAQVTVVPEPGSAALTLCGLAALAARRYRAARAPRA